MRRSGEIRARGARCCEWRRKHDSPQLPSPRPRHRLRARCHNLAAPGAQALHRDRERAGRGETAAEFINRADEQEIREIIRDHGEERFAKQIAAAIVDARSHEPIHRTGQLAAIVGRAVRTREPGQHPATRTFQALRIHVNRELEELEVTLPQAAGLLEPEGRLAVISFHSLEDRIVKRFMREQSTADKLPRGLPVRAKDIPPAPMRLVGKAVKAGDAEVRRNPRARSAVLRVAEKA